MRALNLVELEQVSGGNMAQTQAGLVLAAGAAGVGAAVTRFIPGAQVLSVGLTVISIGLGGLAAAAGGYSDSSKVKRVV